jgi:hypothetical protein
VTTERTRRLIATRNTAVAAESPKTVFKIFVVKRSADRLVYAEFYRRRWQAKTRSSWKPYVWAEISQAGSYGQVFHRQAERKRLRSRKVLNQPSEINHQKSPDFSARILLQDLARQLELYRDLCLNLDRFTVEQIRFVLPLLHRLNRGV